MKLRSLPASVQQRGRHRTAELRFSWARRSTSSGMKSRTLRPAKCLLDHLGSAHTDTAALSSTSTDPARRRDENPTRTAASTPAPQSRLDNGFHAPEPFQFSRSTLTPPFVS
ncbi:hypothetical protein FXW78_25600 [Rhodococcus opacus]|nr:hypothetical protein [Rhodococcus opacus]